MDFFDGSSYDGYSSSKNSFATASLILGGIAIVTITSIVPAMIAGSLSIIFAMLSRRGQNKLLPIAKAGCICSAVSVTLVITIFVACLLYMPKLLQNDAVHSQTKATLQSIYGSEVDVDGFLDAWEEGNLFTLPGTAQKGDSYDD